MQVDFPAFIVDGVFGAFRVGTRWTEVVRMLGEPPLFTAPAGDRPGFARFGDLEFTIHGDRVHVITLGIDEADDTFEVPSVIEIVDYGHGYLLDQIERLLAKHGVSWWKIEEMSDDHDEVYETERGVHLAFRGDVLGRIGATVPRAGG